MTFGWKCCFSAKRGTGSSCVNPFRQCFSNKLLQSRIDENTPHPDCSEPTNSVAALYQQSNWYKRSDRPGLECPANFVPVDKREKLDTSYFSCTCVELPMPTTAHFAARHPSSKEDSTTCPVIRSCAITFQLPFGSLTANGTRSTDGVVFTSTLRAYRS